jgi:type II secretory pathway pseudopilin PulG
MWIPSLIKDKRGLTLIETLIYMGVLGVCMTAFFGILSQMLTVHARNSTRSRLAESAWLALNTLVANLEVAQAVDTTNSTLSSSPSALFFTLNDGTDVAVDVEQTPVDLNGNIGVVPRLHYALIGSEDNYITDSDVEVWMWKVEPVRDSGGVLTGLNLYLGIQVLNRQSLGYQQGRILYQTTVNFVAPTIEI